MYRIVKEPGIMTIDVRDCLDSIGRLYRHPFIGPYALSSAMKSALSKMSIPLRTGSRIPQKFFDKYELLECEYNPKYPGDEHFVTSDMWYTCRPRPLKTF